jgi:hypothetical protein
MPRGPQRPWRELAPHTQQAFPYVNAAIQYGYDVELPITEVTADEMENFRRGLFNAAKAPRRVPALPPDETGGW